jgi:hypothetical protein
MIHNLPETRGRGADYEPYFPSERALTGLLPLTSNYPTAQPFTWPFLTALAELRRLEETVIGVENMAHIFAHSSIVTMATGNKNRYSGVLQVMGN